MTAKDRELIKKAWRLNPIDWGEADVMARQADTPEARRELESISSAKYHQDEAAAGLI